MFRINGSQPRELDSSYLVGGVTDAIAPPAAQGKPLEIKQWKTRTIPERGEEWAIIPVHSFNPGPGPLIN